MDKFMTGVNRAVQICAVFLTAIYFVSGVLYLCFAYWNVTEQDFWRIYDICLNHTWLESALLKFNGHSLFFPAFIWLADLRFFHGYQVMLFVVGLVLLIISTSLLLFPVWGDRTLDLTSKCLATLTVVVGSFWMGRATITASGGYNCMASFVMLGTAASFLLLPRMRGGNPHFWRTTILIVFAGFVATFSWATGLALWPSLLFLGWYLRLPWRSLALLVLGAILAGVIYRLLPPHEGGVAFLGGPGSPGVISLVALKHLCRLVGGPLFHSVLAWEKAQATAEVIQSSAWLLWGGAAGLILAAMVVAPRLLRRDLKGNSVEYIGLAMISFSLLAIVLVVAGRVEHFRRLPFEVAAPRYLFWSSLFWAGILLVLLYHAHRVRWLRWPCIVTVFGASLFAWQEHFDEGLHWRYARYLADECATSLINGVVDPARLLAPTQDQVDVVAPQLRSHRLDMFADGLQDWIGRPVSELSGGRQDSRHFRGRATMERLSGGPDQATAVKVTGTILAKKAHPQPTMVILDPKGTVVGIARSFDSHYFLNRLLYGRRMSGGVLAGYIRHYDATLPYVLRAVGAKGVSKDIIAVVPLPPPHMTSALP
jgi:hypothetical protein